MHYTLPTLFESSLELHALARGTSPNRDCQGQDLVTRHNAICATLNHLWYLDSYRSYHAAKASAANGPAAQVFGTSSLVHRASVALVGLHKVGGAMSMSSSIASQVRRCCGCGCRCCLWRCCTLRCCILRCCILGSNTKKL